MVTPRKRDKRVKARTVTNRQKARSKARQGRGNGSEEPNVRLLMVEHLMRGFKETDLPHATRRTLGMGPRATKQAIEAVRQKWLSQGKQAPGEALRTRELAAIDEVLRILLFDKKGAVRDAAILDMPSIVKALQLRDRVTERLLKNEDQLRRAPAGSFLGAAPDMSGADDLLGRDDTRIEEVPDGEKK